MRLVESDTGTGTSTINDIIGTGIINDVIDLGPDFKSAKF